VSAPAVDVARLVVAFVLIALGPDGGTAHLPYCLLLVRQLGS
jgi:hypothetical protein